MKSIIQSKKECFLCRQLYRVDNVRGLEEHHIFFGSANRKLSEKYGLKVWLCHTHHTGSDKAVHMNKKHDNLLKLIAQETFEREHTRKEFVEVFGKNYIGV